MAKISKFLSQKLIDNRIKHPLIVSTIYDSILEQKFVKEGQSFDLISYIDKGRDYGRYQHHPPCETYPPEEEGIPILSRTYLQAPNDGKQPLLLEKRPVILKICNGIFTEDQVYQFLSQRVSDMLPNRLTTALRDRDILFLGYSLNSKKSDIILMLFCPHLTRDTKRWTVQESFSEKDRNKWNNTYHSRMISMSPSDFIFELNQRLSNS